MNFFNGFSNSSNKTSLIIIIIAAMLGAIIGGSLVASVMLGYLNTDIQNLPDILSDREDEDIPYTERDLPEFKNTAVVKAAEKILPTVVGITNKAMTYDFYNGRSILRERATGTGVIIDSEGYIVTNNHVIDGAVELSITLSNGQEYSARLIGADSATDLAVIKIEGKTLPVASFGDSDDLMVGEMAIAIGNPLGLAFSQTVTVGVISAKERIVNINEHNFTFVQTDAAINDGNSGGPLVNLQGEVIGINTAKIKISGVEGMGFAIPSNTVKNIVRDLIAHGRIIRPWMGVYWGGDVDEKLASELQLPVSYGILIQGVVREGPADKAGIRRGDVIISMSGKKLTNFNEMRRIIFDHRVGDEIELTYYRDNQKATVKVKLDELPEHVE